MSNGKILVLSGPSGSGKSSLLKEIFKKFNNLYFSISTTTRKIRDGEKDGLDYFFIKKDEFQKDIKSNNFLEWAEVHSNYYGTSLKPIKKALNDGKLVIFDIDVQGNENVVKQFKDITTSVFITTPSKNELEKRLINRGTDDKNTISKRLSNAINEIEYISKYEYLIVNNNFEVALKQLILIIELILEKIDTKQIDKLDNFIRNWKV
jgi:guanylate kinase